MARPMKDGIDYFSFDVILDDKWELIEAEFGLTGFAVVVKLLQKIYSLGYYCEWTNEVELLFAHKLGLGGNSVSEIVRASIKRGIFDKEMFDKYHILTSRGIQKRYFEAVSRRKDFKVEDKYLLVNAVKNSVNVCNNSKNVCNNPENVYINSQSKGKESKVKESKYIGTSSRFVPPTLEQVTEYCKRRKNRVDPEAWYNHYSSNGWMVGRTKMKDWKAAVRTWEKNNFSKKAEPENKKKSYDMDEVKELFNDQ